MKRKMDAVDRISELPDPILHHMLSFLPLQQVVQTVVLSKRWKQSWDTFPILEFHGSSEDSIDRNKMILRFLEQTLLSRCMDRISVKKFTLEMQFPLDPETLTSLSRCLSYAIESNVKILNLLLLEGLDYLDWYNLPPIVFCSKSIDVLELSGCNLVVPTSNVMLSSLRRLCLSVVAASDGMIENVVVGSPLIEHLEIISCDGLTSLELAGLSRLNTVIVSGNDTLERLKINVQNVREIDISDMPLCVISLACENLKHLGLRDIYITDNCLCNEISKCPLLESLIIDQCSELQNMKVSSHCLKKLCISECSNLFEVNIKTPNLSKFKYNGDLISFSSNDLALPEVDLYFVSENIDTEWFVKYVELLAKFRFSKALTLHSRTGENMIIPKELRKILCPPLSGVSQLNLTVYNVERLVSDCLDGLLWMSPHVETIFAALEDSKDGYPSNATIQFSYNKELNCEGGLKNPPCCQSLPVSCWQHCMKEINIEIARTYRGKITIKAERLALQGRKFLKKLDGFFRFRLV